MKTEAEIRKYLDHQGVPYVEPIYAGVPKLRVMDLSQVPNSMREQFDDRGFFLAPDAEKPDSTGSKK